MRSRVWVVVDSTMLLVVVVLQAWRLTGVILHEWLSVALIAGLIAHLLLHWPVSWDQEACGKIWRWLASARSRNPHESGVH